MNKKRYPSAAPNDKHWGERPKSIWQSRLRGTLLLLLGRGGWQSRRASLLYFKDNMVQVYLDNWTLHFQVGVGDEEFQNIEMYEDFDDKALIAFDVENGGRGVKTSDLKELQKQIREELQTNGVYDKLGVDAADPKQHHLLMETAPANDVDFVAKRLVEYMDAVYDVANPVLERMQNE